MRTTVKIILIATILAFAMQSTAMEKWQLKPSEEIAKNLGKRAAENPDIKKAVAEKLTEKNDDKDKDDKEKTDTDKSDK